MSRNWGARLLIACIALSLALSGQSQNYFFKQIGQANGLADQFVYDVTIDSSGVLWAATSGGIFQYNGYSGSMIGPESGLPEEFVSKFAVRDSASLLVGGYTGSVSVLQQQTASAISLQSDQGQVVALLPAGARTIVVSKSGLIRVLDSDSVVLEQPLDIAGQISCAIKLSVDTFLIGSNSGLYVLTLHNMEFSVSELLKEHAITALAANSNTVLVADDWNRLYTLNPRSLRLSNELKWKFSGNPTWSVSNLLKADEHAFWVAGFNNLLKIKVEESTVTLLSSFDQTNGATFEIPTSMVADRDGSLWIGTKGRGLWMLPARYFGLLELPEVYALVEADDQTLYAATQEGIFHLSAPQVGAFEVLQQWSTASAVTALELHNNQLYYAVESQGIFRLEGNRSVRVAELGDLGVESHINHVYSAADGALWISGIVTGCTRFDDETGELQRLNTTNGLLHNDIYQVFEDAQAQLWFVTTGTGLAKLDRSGFTYFDPRSGLSFPNLECMTTGPDNRAWIGTSGAGLFVYADSVFVQHNTETGLPKNYVRSLAFDNKGYAWMASAKGLSCYDPTSGTALNYTGAPESLSLEFNPRCGIKTNSGNLLFGTDKGLAIVASVAGTLAPQVSCSINAVAISGNQVSTSEALELPYSSQHRLQIEFAAVSLQGPSEVRYSYKLTGQTEQWSAPTTATEVLYSGLAPGNYTFYVRAAMPGQPPSDASAFHFSIATPFWQTGWFLALVSMLTVLMIALIIRLREYRLKLDKKRLEVQVTERTREIAEQQAQLEQFTYAVSHDLKNPVINIAGLSEVLHEVVGNDKEEASEILGMLQTNAKHLQTNLSNLMAVLKAQRSLQKEWEYINLPKLLEEIRATLTVSMTENKARIETDFADASTAYFPKSDLQSILYNLISNGIKYRSPDRDPVVRVASQSVPDYLQLTVSDNGMGMDLDKDGAKLFGMFKRLHSHVEGSGVGLHLIKTIIEKAGGSIVVASELGVGSTFTVRLPLTPPQQNTAG